MPNQKICVLDGTQAHDKQLNAIFSLLIDELHQYEGAKVMTFKLRDIKIKHCIGCFSCWLKTPGRCVHTADAGASILQAILNTQTLILFTPVVFGGYSSELKKILDRLLPLTLPIFNKNEGDTHHPSRYNKIPRLVGIGIHPHPHKESIRCFQTLIGRNALNYNSLSFAVDVVNSTDSHKEIRHQIHSLLTRTDKVPRRRTLESLISNRVSSQDIPTAKRKALLIVGSPKITTASTSSVLGGHLLKQLNKKYGLTTESLTLNANLLFEKEQDNLYSAIVRADTILIAFPLYFDALPFLVTKAFEVIAARLDTVKTDQKKMLLAIVNSGFPEVHHNMVALTICRNFSIECGLEWAGGLVLGGGEGLLSGHLATEFKGRNGLKRPPLYYINRALNITAAMLAKGHPAPEKAVLLMAKKPVPFISFSTWRWLYTKMGEKTWEQEVVSNGLNRDAIFDKPYKAHPKSQAQSSNR